MQLLTRSLAIKESWGVLGKYWLSHLGALYTTDGVYLGSMADNDIESFWDGLRPPPLPPEEQRQKAIETGLCRAREEALNHPHWAVSWRNPGEPGSGPLTDLVRAFTELGLSVDTHFEFDRSVLSLVIGDQTIHLETTDGQTRVRVFDLLPDTQIVIA